MTDSESPSPGTSGLQLNITNGLGKVYLLLSDLISCPGISLMVRYICVKLSDS
jgi:hypothetical protein